MSRVSSTLLFYARNKKDLPLPRNGHFYAIARGLLEAERSDGKTNKIFEDRQYSRLLVKALDNTPVSINPVAILIT